MCIPKPAFLTLSGYQRCDSHSDLLEALMSAKEHEMHCRAQLMLIERMLGIVPHLTRKYAEMEREMREAAAKKAGQTMPA